MRLTLGSGYGCPGTHLLDPALGVVRRVDLRAAVFFLVAFLDEVRFEAFFEGFFFVAFRAAFFAALRVAFFAGLRVAFFAGLRVAFFAGFRAAFFFFAALAILFFPQM